MTFILGFIAKESTKSRLLTGKLDSALSRNKRLNRLFSVAENQTISINKSYETEETKHRTRVIYPQVETQEDPLHWAKNFGRRSQAKTNELHKLAKLSKGDEGYYSTPSSDQLEAQLAEAVTIVRNKEQALIVLEKLMASDHSRIHACDTEVMEINLKEVGPVGNGYVTCLSVYSGPDFDYGLGQPPGSTLWIDNLDEAFGIIHHFKPWLEDSNHLKVWHNYGFDRHVLFNEGIDVLGFGGDTMHMARLENTARDSFSLASLSEALLEYEQKTPMKELFGVPRLRKDGSEGNILDLPPIQELQRNPKFRANWILYSAKDAKATFSLYQKLKIKLQSTPWYNGKNLFQYYHTYMRPFGELLTDLERRGIRVDAKHYLSNVEKQARIDRQNHLDTFRKWAFQRIGPDGLAINPASSIQLSTFLFGGAKNTKTKEETEHTKIFKVLREELSQQAIDAYNKNDHNKNDIASSTNFSDFSFDFDQMKATDLKKLCKMFKITSNGNKSELQQRIIAYALSFTPELNHSNEKNDDIFESMKLAELKSKCEEYGLKKSGKKSELQQRLREHLGIETSNEKHESLTNSHYYSMTLHELTSTCIAKQIPRYDISQLDEKQQKIELIKLLTEDDKMLKTLDEMYNSTSKDNSSTNYNSQNEYLTYDHEIFLKKLNEIADCNADFKKFLDEVKNGAFSPQESRYVDVTVTSIGLTPEKFTQSGAPSATADVLKTLAGDPFNDPPKYGRAYDFFCKSEGHDAAHDACVALYSLTAIGSIDTMISNFLTSLQSLSDEDSRVHCSLNLNTETGRLSSRKPNLQNQPALEKDTYKIRKAFQSSPGNNLIVADYGQLELRLLASMTNCKSMIDAFIHGGDFHARTAMGMFQYIKDRVDNGEILFEWDYSKGEPPKPLLKDEYASERRKAKTLNFSIAYGKTAFGLSKDWGVTRDAAEETLQAWYDSRPEVLEWQKQTKERAKKEGITRTLMGRYRHLPHAKSGNKKYLGHAERASINTPIQGGAADVAMMAMLKINNSHKLKELGWILIMQIHDEVILEGPEETAKEAFDEVIHCMEEPWVEGLEKTSVPLLVDGSHIHKDWYAAK